MKQRVTDTPEAVLKFAPKDRPSDDNDPTDQSGRAVVALLQQAASQSNDTCERAMSLAHKLSVQLRAAEDQINQLRGQLEFFQNRATAATPSWGGGGSFLSSGFMYFHNGNGPTCGTNTSCLTLQGNSGSQSFTLGNIVADKIALGGSPQINMILNPTATFSVLRPSLLM